MNNEESVFEIEKAEVVSDYIPEKHAESDSGREITDFSKVENDDKSPIRNNLSDSDNCVEREESKGESSFEMIAERKASINFEKLGGIDEDFEDFCRITVRKQDLQFNKSDKKKAKKAKKIKQVSYEEVITENDFVLLNEKPFIFTEQDWVKILKRDDIFKTSRSRIKESLLHGISPHLYLIIHCLFHLYPLAFLFISFRRGYVWMFLSKARHFSKKFSKDTFQKLVNIPDELTEASILKDIYRTFPTHEYFKEVKQKCFSKSFILLFFRKMEMGKLNYTKF
jgi:hypothetical protein